MLIMAGLFSKHMGGNHLSRLTLGCCALTFGPRCVRARRGPPAFRDNFISGIRATDDMAPKPACSLERANSLKTRDAGGRTRGGVARSDDSRH